MKAMHNQAFTDTYAEVRKTQPGESSARALFAAGVAAERERCAAICDKVYVEEQKEPECGHFAKECAEMIRED